jgi:uncharacterized protein YdaU (DUF1376 family)
MHVLSILTRNVSQQKAVAYLLLFMLSHAVPVDTLEHRTAYIRVAGSLEKNKREAETSELDVTALVCSFFSNVSILSMAVLSRLYTYGRTCYRL